MNYLDASEYEAFGLEAETAEGWVVAASALMDAHCRRKTLAIDAYTERLRLAPGRNSVRVTYLPLATSASDGVPLTKLRARYASARRGEGAGEMAADFACAFGLPGQWVEMDCGSIDFCAETGELSLPMHPLGLGYNEIEVSYTAGVEPGSEVLKIACAQLVRNAQATPALNTRGHGVDQMHMEYFSDSLLDSNVRKLLAPYVAQKVG
jgi:hypothetical protein